MPVEFFQDLKQSAALSTHKVGQKQDLRKKAIAH